MTEHTAESLARKLGLVDRLVFSKPTRQGETKKCNDLVHVIAVKFQTTALNPDQPSPGTEIIDFAAVALCLKTESIVATFQQYVMPTEHETIPSYCVESTGVTREMVDNGVPLKTCMMLYSNWLRKLHQDIGLRLPCKLGVKNPPTIHVTWSDLDLGTYLPSEARRKRCTYDKNLTNWADLRTVYAKFHGNQASSLKIAMDSLKVRWKTKSDLSLEYATNIGNLAMAMYEKGYALECTSKC